MNMPSVHPPAAATPPGTAPCEVFYVVETSGSVRKRQHHTSSLLYETRPQAETERRQLMEANPGKIYSVWKHTTYIEPAVWLADVEMADGSVLQAPR
jgi:hypothetical protein